MLFAFHQSKDKSSCFAELCRLFLKSLRKILRAQRLPALSVVVLLGHGTDEKTGFAKDVMKRISGSCDFLVLKRWGSKRIQRNELCVTEL